jgi:hypothetical protein
VLVDFGQRAIGTLTRGKRQFVAVARRGESPAWALVRIRAVSRALPGPYAGAPACAP